MRKNLHLSKEITINLRELHFHSKEQAEDKSCIVVTIFNAACTLGEEGGGNRKHYHTYAIHIMLSTEGCEIILFSLFNLYATN